MARRMRLLIYEGPEEWIEGNKKHEFVKLGTKELGKERAITSVEITNGVVYALVRQTGEVEAVFVSIKDAGEVSKSWPGSTIQQTWLNGELGK